MPARSRWFEDRGAVVERAAISLGQAARCARLGPVWSVGRRAVSPRTALVGLAHRLQDSCASETLWLPAGTSSLAPCHQRPLGCRYAVSANISLELRYDRATK